MVRSQDDIKKLSEMIRRLPFYSAFRSVLFEFGIRKERLAADCCLSVSNLYHYCSGDSEPTKRTLILIALMARFPAEISQGLMYSLGIQLNNSVADQFFARLIADPQPMTIYELNSRIKDENQSLGEDVIPLYKVW